MGATSILAVRRGPYPDLTATAARFGRPARRNQRDAERLRDTPDGISSGLDGRAAEACAASARQDPGTSSRFKA